MNPTTSSYPSPASQWYYKSRLAPRVWELRTVPLIRRLLANVADYSNVFYSCMGVVVFLGICILNHSCEMWIVSALATGLITLFFSVSTNSSITTIGMWIASIHCYYISRFTFLATSDATSARHQTSILPCATKRIRKLSPCDGCSWQNFILWSERKLYLLTHVYSPSFRGVLHSSHWR